MMQLGDYEWARLSDDIVLVATADRGSLYRFSDLQAEDPIRCVGYAYTLERLAMSVDEAALRAVERMLPPGVQATLCMRVHSAVGSDAIHVAETVNAAGHGLAGLFSDDELRRMVKRERIQIGVLCLAMLMIGWMLGVLTVLHGVMPKPW